MANEDSFKDAARVPKRPSPVEAPRGTDDLARVYGRTAERTTGLVSLAAAFAGLVDVAAEGIEGVREGPRDPPTPRNPVISTSTGGP